MNTAECPIWEQEEGACPEADATVEAAPESQVERREVSPEAREAMNEARRGRLDLLKRVLTSEIASTGLNLVPVAGGLKMTAEAGYGRTLAGQDLSGKQRLVHGLVGVSNAALDCLGGVSSLVRGLKTANRSVTVMRHVAAMLKGDGTSAGYRLLTVTADFMARNPEVVEAAERAYGYVTDQRTKLAEAQVEVAAAGEGAI